jgi:hypothetical protein
MNLKHHLLIAALCAVSVSTMLMPNAYAKHLSDNQRYNDGFNDGSNAARADRENGNQFNPACDPTGAHTSDGQHTTIYCSGWSDGYNSAWGGPIEQTLTQNQHQEQKQSQTVHTCIALRCDIIQGQDQQSNQGIGGGQ